MVFGALIVGALGVAAARRGVHAYRRTKQEIEQERSMYNAASRSSRKPRQGRDYHYSSRYYY